MSKKISYLNIEFPKMFLQNVFPLCLLILLLLGLQETSSTTDDVIAEVEKDLCSSYCLAKSAKGSLAYQIKVIEQGQLDAKMENSQLRGENNAKNKLIEEQFGTIEDLRKSNEDLLKLLGESIKQQINSAKTNEKQLDESREYRNEIEKNYKHELRKTINDLKSKEKELEDDKVNKDNLNIKINKLMFQVNETQNKLRVQKALVESNLIKLNQTENMLNECKKKLPACIDLPSGINKVKIPGHEPFSALCNAEIKGGGWLVVQKRFDGSENFKRNFTDFSNGFGQLESEFFIGLEQLYRLTNSQRYELHMQFENFEGTFDSATFDHFRIGNRTEKYKLHSLGEYSGTYEGINRKMSECLQYEFNTFEYNTQCVCPARFSAWWTCNDCEGLGLNGKYYNSSVFEMGSMSWNGFWSVKSLQMLVRPKL